MRHTNTIVTASVMLGILALGTIGVNAATADRVAGKMLLQVEGKGEAWYVHPATKERWSLGRPDDAFRVMREQGVGITNADLNKIPIGVSFAAATDSDADGLPDTAEDAIGSNKNAADTDSDSFTDINEARDGYNVNGAGKRAIDTAFTAKQHGKIFLQVEGKGEAWWVNPDDSRRYFLGRPADAYELMRKYALGISNNDLGSIVQGGTATSAPVASSNANCTNESCFATQFAACTPSVSTIDSGIVKVIYTITGPSTDGCDLYVTYEKAPMPAWVGKSMACVLDNAKSSDDALTSALNDQTDGGIGCEGPLFDSMMTPPAAAEETPIVAKQNLPNTIVATGTFTSDDDDAKIVNSATEAAAIWSGLTPEGSATMPNINYATKSAVFIFDGTIITGYDRSGITIGIKADGTIDISGKFSPGEEGCPAEDAPRRFTMLEVEKIPEAVLEKDLISEMFSGDASANECP